MSDYVIERLTRPALIKIVKEQQEIINKAIEYIENDMPYLEEPDNDYENNHKMREYDKSNLLNILKGENNEYNK